MFTELRPFFGNFKRMKCFSIEVTETAFNLSFDFPEKLILASSVLIFGFQESLNRIPSPFLVDESQLDLSGFEKSGKRFRQYRLEERAVLYLYHDYAFLVVLRSPSATPTFSRRYSFLNIRR